MIGNQFRTLTVGDRLLEKHRHTELVTIVGIAWSEVSIDCDDGHSTSIQRNDMARIETV
jgi:hypothetical protein